MLGLDGFELDGYLFARDNVGAEIDIAEATTTNFTANAVLVADAKIL